MSESVIRVAEVTRRFGATTALDGKVADHVTMINHGRVALSASLDERKQSHRCVTVRFAEAQPRPPAVAGVLRWHGSGQEWTAIGRDVSGELFVAHVGVPAASGAEA